MIKLIIAATLCLSAGIEQAGATEPVITAQATPDSSILTLTCKSCAPLPKPNADDIKLAPGEMIRKVEDVDGVMKIYRTENMLGGSPVTIVRKADDEDILAYGNEAQKATLMAKIEAEKSHDVAEINEPAIASDEQMTASGTPKVVDTQQPVATAAMESAPDEADTKQPAVAMGEPAIDSSTTTSALGKKQGKPLDADSFKLRTYNQ